jgi:hypothetical protein
MKVVMEIAEVLSNQFVTALLLTIVILLVFWSVKYGFLDPPPH